jgi:hypothetical protein
LGLRQYLKSQGFGDSYIDRTMADFESANGKVTAARHVRVWNNSWVPWCQQHGFHPFDYDVVCFSNFLSQIQDAAEGKQGIAKNHSVFKYTRAAVAAVLLIVHPEKPSIAEQRPIKRLASRLRASAPNLPKYTQRVSLSPLFARYVHAECQKGSYFRNDAIERSPQSRYNYVTCAHLCPIWGHWCY